MNKVEELQESYIWMDGVCVTADIVWASSSHLEVMVEFATQIPEDSIVALVLRGFLSLPMRVTQQVGSCVVLSFEQPPHHSVVDWINRYLVTAETKAIRDFLEENAIPFAMSVRSGEPTAQEHEVDAQLADLFRARTRSLSYLEPSKKRSRAA